MLTCESWFWKLVILIALLQSNDLSAISSEDVDPFIGTGGWFQSTANVFLGASVPFGQVRLGPDASLEPGSFLDRFIGHANIATSGYHRSFGHFRGFSHTRLSGAGVREGGLIRVLPSQVSREFSDPPSNAGALTTDDKIINQ